jgi:hypothetical protein
VLRLSRKAWTYAKRTLSFTRVTQDGDEEGMLIMDRLPTAEEAEAFGSYLGINKEREYDETLARLREKGRRRGDEREKVHLRGRSRYLALRRARKRFLKPHRGRRRERGIEADGGQA